MDFNFIEVIHNLDLDENAYICVLHVYHSYIESIGTQSFDWPAASQSSEGLLPIDYTKRCKI